MAVKTKKLQSKETPSEQFERVMQKVMNRQRRRDERRAKEIKGSLGVPNRSSRGRAS